MGCYHVFHAWFYMLFLIFWAPVRFEHFSKLMSNKWWDQNAQRDGLLNKKGAGLLRSICLGKWSSHHRIQGCLWVGIWDGGTVCRYRGKWWGRRHQNHTIIHPLWSFKPHCVIPFLEGAAPGACCFLVLTPLFPQGCCYSMTQS